MDNKETKDILIDQIVDMIDGLSELEPGSKERSAEVENLTKLYRLKIEETKNELDYFKEQDRRAMEDRHHEADEQLKREQMETDAELKREEMNRDDAAKERDEQLKKEENKNEWLRLVANLGVTCAMSILTLACYNAWYNRGLRFHQTDTITEPMTKALQAKLGSLPFLKK